MQFELPGLSYKYNALEPYIDAQTMEIHHVKHHQGYVNKLNAALEKYPSVVKNIENKQELEALEWLLKNLDSLPQDVRVAVRNNGGGHWNHSLFWRVMCQADKAGKPIDGLMKAIERDFGDFEKFKGEFSVAAAGVFGSGWVWLIIKDEAENMKQEKNEKKLSIITTPNQNSPISQGLDPVLGLDVWEHAYYLKYQNKRPDYIEAWWSVVNWNMVAQRFENGL